jgi:aminoglycoside phosphotransferase (APT) family kinase protein
MKEKPPIVTKTSATQILQHHFGRRPKMVKRIHGGLANHVFEAQIDRAEVVLRISSKPAKLQTFMKEQWAVTEARKNKIPTPEILEVCNDIIGLPYMISRKVVGSSGENVAGLERCEVLRELGEYAATINAIKTRDFGHIFDWSPNKLSRNRTWQDFLENELDLEGRLESLLRHKILEPANAKKIHAQVQLMKRWNATPSLCHGDIRLKNVILDGKQKIVAILDWENCSSNIAPYWELSIALHDLTMDEKEVFLEGYGINLKDYLKLAPAIKTLNVLNYVRSAHHAIKRKDQKRLLCLRTRLNGAFDLYSL